MHCELLLLFLSHIVSCRICLMSHAVALLASLALAKPVAVS